jgi:hypothetical protein
MATTFSNSKTYAGELARPYIAAAIKSGTTIGEGKITVKEGVKYREVLRKLDTAGLVQAAACDFTPAGVVDLSEVILEPTELMTNIQLCKKDFRADWEALNTGRGFINDQLPPEFQQYLLLHVASKIGEAMEDNVWKGGAWDSTGSTGNDLPAAAADGADDGSDIGDSLTDTFDENHFDGLLVRIKAGGSNTQSAGSGAVFSTSNILTNLDTCIDALPTALQGDSEVKIYMSPKTYYIYYRKLVSAGTHPGFNYATDINNNYLGYQLHVCPGMANDAVLAARPDNLFFGTDLKSDHNSATFIDMTGMDGSDNVRIAYRFTGGTQVGVVGDTSLVSRYATT